MARTNLEIVISAKDQFSGTANKVIGTLNRMDSSAGRVGKGVGQLGLGLARVGVVAGTIAAGGLIGAAKAAIDFEDAFAGVRKTVDEADLAKAGLTFDGLAKSFRGMATEIPVAATELARIGETAGALGIAAGDITEFTRVIALMGATTNLTTAAAAEGMGKLGTILGLTGDDFGELADAIVALGNKGASTEVEIVELSKRFAAAGRQAGLYKEEIVALASAAASLGIEPEAGGSALSRLFSNMASDIALATDEGKAFATITGQSLRSLEDQIRGGKGLSIFLAVLDKIQGMDRIQAAKALQALGITNVRDRDAVLKMAQNLEFVNDQLEISRTSTGSLSEEAQKRFDTIASKLTLVKNSAIEAGIAVGEGMLPALGRAADKLRAFVMDPKTQNDLKAFGRDVGTFIDGINWTEVNEGARTFASILGDALGIIKNVVSELNKLPPEIKALGVSALVLDKLSGGLLHQGAANILGGLLEPIARNAASKLPGVGRLFAQPVFVTNWPLGGLGPGVPGPGGAKPVPTPGGFALPKIGAAISLGWILDDIERRTRDPKTGEWVPTSPPGSKGNTSLGPVTGGGSSRGGSWDLNFFGNLFSKQTTETQRTRRSVDDVARASNRAAATNKEQERALAALRAENRVQSRSIVAAIDRKKFNAVQEVTVNVRLDGRRVTTSTVRHTPLASPHLDPR